MGQDSTHPLWKVDCPFQFAQHLGGWEQLGIILGVVRHSVGTRDTNEFVLTNNYVGSKFPIGYSIAHLWEQIAS
jgi:hypothetical protein